MDKTLELKKNVGGAINANMKALSLVRDAKGISTLADMIYQSSVNLGSTTSEDGVQAYFKSLGIKPELKSNPYSVKTKDAGGDTSAAAGINALGGAYTVSALDLSIAKAVYSIIGYIACEREMRSQKYVLYWRNVLATNDVAGYKDSIVIGNWKPMPTDGNLGFPTGSGSVEGDGSSKPSIVLNCAIVPGTVKVTYTVGGKVSIGQDLNRDGVIYFKGENSLNLKMDYITGTLGLADESAAVPASGSTLALEAMKDATADRTGKSYQRVTNRWDDIVVEAEPGGIVFEDNLQTLANHKKLLESSGQFGLDIEPQQRILQDLTLIYINFLNIKALDKINEVIKPKLSAIPEIDYVGFDNNAVTSEKVLWKFNLGINASRSYMLRKCNYSPNFFIVGTEAANILMSDAVRFEAAEDNPFGTLDMLIGFYDGTPVYRHHWVDDILDKGGNVAHIIQTYKDPSGDFGAFIYGEWLPIHTTPVVYNYENNNQFSQTLQSTFALECIVPDMIQCGGR